MTCVCADCGITKTQFIRNGQIGSGPVKEEKYTCGLDPKKKPYSMKKCLDMNQVRYWVKYQIDPDVLAAGPQRDQEKTRMNLLSQRIAVNAALKKLRDQKLYTSRFDTDVLNEISEKGKKLLAQRNTINKKLQNLQKQMTPSTGTKLKILVWEDIDDSAIDRKYADVMRRSRFQMSKLEKIDDSAIDRKYSDLMMGRTGKTSENGAKGWKNDASGINAAEIERRFEQFFGPPDPIVMSNIETFAETMKKADNGTMKQRGKFFIEKISPIKHNINYWFHPKGLKHTNQMVNYWTGNLNTLKDQLYQIDKGMVVFKYNVATTINNLV